jgi:hypothetical protein
MKIKRIKRADVPKLVAELATFEGCNIGRTMEILLLEALMARSALVKNAGE